MNRLAADKADRPAGARATRTRESLTRIADMIGCDVGLLTGEISDPTHPLSGASELLQLWLTLPTGEERAKVLDLARRLARLT